VDVTAAALAIAPQATADRDHDQPTDLIFARPRGLGDFASFFLLLGIHHLSSPVSANFRTFARILHVLSASKIDIHHAEALGITSAIRIIQQAQW